jgi:hypothetical protein
MSRIAAYLIAYFRTPFPRRTGFSPYRSPGLLAHVPLLLAFAMTGVFLHAPGISPFSLIWLIAGIYLGRDFAILCHYIPGAFLACWFLFAVVASKAVAIRDYGVAHHAVAVAATATVALLVIARAAFTAVSGAREERATSTAARTQAAPTQRPNLYVFTPDGNCARCGFNRLNSNEWRDELTQHAAPGVCTIRGFDIESPLTTYCRNYDSRDATPLGAVYTISREHGNVALPWVDMAVPHMASATCCICGQHAPAGILLMLPDAEVGVCGPEHYLQWWIDYQQRRLDYFKALGEKAYSDMYDVVFSGATAHYSNAKEAFYCAIRTARDLELTDELKALDARLEHIKQVFRHQFK